jgi:hypothetical protein
MTTYSEEHDVFVPLSEVCVARLLELRSAPEERLDRIVYRIAL